MIVVGRHVFFRAVLRWGAALAFCYPLKHRERFWLRAVELLLSLMALTWLLDPMAQSNSLVQLQVSLLGMYVGFFILLGAMIYAGCSPVFISMKPPVPNVFFASPGVKQVWPKSAACWSPAAPAILMPSPKCMGSAHS